MMLSTAATCTDLVPRTSRTAAGRARTKVIHQLLPMVMSQRHHQHQPQHRANSCMSDQRLCRRIVSHVSC